MQGPARILIVGRDDAHHKELAEALRVAGFESTMGDIAQSAAELTGSRFPDIVILNMQSAEARKSPRAYLALAETLKKSALSSRMRIMCVGVTGDLDLNGKATVIDDLLVGDVHPDQICHRLRSLVRLNTMHEELVRSSAPRPNTASTRHRRSHRRAKSTMQPSWCWASRPISA